MLSSDQNKQFHEILEELSKNLDITPAQYEAAVKKLSICRRMVIKTWIPTRSSWDRTARVFPLGTMTRPIHEERQLGCWPGLSSDITYQTNDVKKIVIV